MREKGIVWERRVCFGRGGFALGEEGMVWERRVWFEREGYCLGEELGAGIGECKGHRREIWEECNNYLSGHCFDFLCIIFVQNDLHMDMCQLACRN